MDMDLYDAVRNAVQLAHTLHDSLANMLTREWLDPADDHRVLATAGRRNTVPPLGA